jgi:hypothetical protein
MDLPILPETYWNPYTKELVVDRQLGQVITSPKWSLEESQKATQESWYGICPPLLSCPLPPLLSSPKVGSCRGIRMSRNAHITNLRSLLCPPSPSFFDNGSLIERLLNEKINRSTSLFRSYSSCDPNLIGSYPSLHSPSLLSPERPEI